MKKSSIKRDIYLYLFGLVISLIAFYSVMINQSYNIGLNESAKYALLYEISSIEHTYLTTGQVEEVTSSETFRVYTDFNNMPSQFMNYFDWMNFKEDTIYESYIEKTADKAPQYLYATYHQIKDSDIYLYIVSQYDEQLYIELFKEYPPQSINQFNTVVGGLLMLLVFLIVRLLIHRITKPVLTLAKWAETLDLNNRSDIESLRYDELNLLSNQLVNSIEKQREVIEREEFFLRATSHELRTPIAVVSASSEMLERVKKDLPKSSQRAIGRIGRSMTSMHGLINTLLWLSRENKDDLDREDIQLDSLVQDIIDDHAYLIQDKEIEVKSPPSTEGNTLTSEVKMLVSIVIMNLIRNAIQHTDSGQIEIMTTPTSIEIKNTYTASVSEKKDSIYDTSFGVGLFLVEKICHKQNWQFEHKQENNHFYVTIRFK